MKKILLFIVLLAALAFILSGEIPSDQLPAGFESIPNAASKLGTALSLKAHRLTKLGETKSGFQLRGLGKLQVQARTLGFGKEIGSWTTFTAKDASRAAMCGSKFLTDAKWGPVKEVQVSNWPGTALHLPGTGWWLLGVSGNRFEVLFAHSEAQLQALIQGARAKKWAPVTPNAFPRWLNCFDKSAVGFWIHGGGVLAEDLDKDFQWLADRGFTACFADTTEGRLVAPGVLDDSAMEWEQAMAQKYGFSYRTLMNWTRPARPKWLWNRVPLPYVKSQDGYQAGGDFEHLQVYANDTFEPLAATDAYQSDLRRRIAGRQGKFSNFIGHHGSAEFGGTGLPELARVSGQPEIQELWRKYLGDQLGLTLEQVGRMHKGSPTAYKSWSEVEIPLPQTIFGWNASSVDLRGVWEGAADPDAVGRDQKWFENGGGQSWTPISCNDPLAMLYKEKKPGSDKTPNFWLRRKVSLNKAQAASLRYIHISRARWHSYFFGGANPTEPVYLQVYLNGKPARELTVHDPVRADDDLCFDLGDLSIEGENTLTLNTKGESIPSYIFLSPEGRWDYPSADPTRNRLFYDATNFIVWLRMRHLEDSLKAMRSDEPYRPIKIMSPYPVVDQVRDLCERYGAYMHDTGQNGACWAPWMTRFALARGQVASSEPGGPARDAQAIQQMMTFYLMLGNSVVDMVFHVQSYRTTPDIAQWIDNHLDLIHCIGKMNMVEPEIGVLRSTRDVRLKFQAPWSWDLGRGEIQSVGRTFNYAELDDITSGRANRMFKIIIDDGTAVMTEEEVKGLERYVRQGGIFIALHNTGMHTPEQAWAWPISKLTGLTVVNRSEVSGQLQFRQDQTLWPKLQGREIRGWGIVLDWTGKNVTGESLGLKSGEEDVKVVAEWKDRPEAEGRIAVAYRNLGKGKVITLGSSFWRSAQDTSGRYQSNEGSCVYLNELLESLGNPRESWRTGGDATRDVFVEHWRSKNGIFDLYPVARISEVAKQSVTLDASWQRAVPTRSLIEISAPGNPSREVQWKDGAMTLPNLTLGAMESRVYAAARPDIEKAALYWIETQQRQWPALAPIPKAEKAPLQPAVADVLPLQTDWRLTGGEAWPAVPPAEVAADGKPVKLGTFSILGLPEDAVAHFRKTQEIPRAWAGQRVFFRFDSENWFWGIRPKGRLWINGKPAPFSVTGDQVSAFSIEVTEAARDGKLELALEVDGRVAREAERKGRPSGVTGAFYLQAEPKPVASLVLGNWKAGTGAHATLESNTPGAAYLETRFTLPSQWPAPRLFVEVDPSVRQMGWLMINDQPLEIPTWMKSLDISGLVHRNGENILRWVPRTTATEVKWVSLNRPFDASKIPEMKLNWLP